MNYLRPYTQDTSQSHELKINRRWDSFDSNAHPSCYKSYYCDNTAVLTKKIREAYEKDLKFVYFVCDDHIDQVLFYQDVYPNDCPEEERVLDQKPRRILNETNRNNRQDYIAKIGY